jgi:short-subunit dehydrogenase
MRGRRVVVPGLINKLFLLLIRFFPRRLVLAAMDRQHRRSAQRT